MDFIPYEVFLDSFSLQPLTSHLSAKPLVCIFRIPPKSNHISPPPLSPPSRPPFSPCPHKLFSTPESKPEGSCQIHIRSRSSPFLIRVKSTSPWWSKVFQDLVLRYFFAFIPCSSPLCSLNSSHAGLFTVSQTV